MSGDWIKMRGNLWDDPRVSALVDATDSSEAAVVGALYWLWASADQHSEDGVMPGLSVRQIDRKTGVPGFAAALETIGWIEVLDAGSRIGRCDEHNGQSAKRRGEDAKRKAAVRNGSAPKADKTRTDSGQVPELEKEKEKELDQKQDQKRAPAAPTPADLFPDVDPDHLRDWVAARKAKRLPLTETAAKGFRRAADKAGMTAAEAVKFCAEKGWAGLYADTQQGGNARAGPQQAQPVGKQMQGLMALEAMKSGNRMAAGRGTERAAETVLLVAGSDARR
mgnify:FL=1